MWHFFYKKPTCLSQNTNKPRLLEVNEVGPLGRIRKAEYLKTVRPNF